MTVTVEQGSPEWFEMRLGKVTASRIADVMAKGRGGAMAVTRRNYMAQLVAERLTGKPTRDTFKNAHMEHGTETEPRARAAYEFFKDSEVDQVAFVEHPTIEFAGASPDGLVGVKGGTEIKCPTTPIHIERLEGKDLERNYRLQIQWNMACTQREWWDFCSFDPDLPESMQLHVCPIMRDDAEISEIESEVMIFNAEVAAKVAELSQQYGLQSAA